MNVGLAFLRAVSSLAQPAVVKHFLWPVLVSIVVWALFAVWALTSLEARSVADLLTQNFPPALGEWLRGLGQLALWALVLVSAFLLIYPTTLIITAMFAVPLMVAAVARREYAGLEKKQGGSLWGSVGNALSSTLGLVLLVPFCLPLYFIPPLGVLASLLLAAWFNKRMCQYDALMDYASADERRALVQHHRRGLWAIALLSSALAPLPLVNFLAPALAGLWFVHFCLGNLQQLRDEARR